MTGVLSASFALSVGRRDRRFTVEADLTLDTGLLVLFGPSGAGKSLTIQALAGLIRPDRGYINVRDEVYFDDSCGRFIAPQRRSVGYVPQHHSLFPFLDVRGNVGFGLPRR